MEKRKCRHCAPGGSVAAASAATSIGQSVSSPEEAPPSFRQTAASPEGAATPKAGSAQDEPGTGTAGGPPHDARRTERSDAEKKSLVSRCNRIEGQIRGIRAMIENDIWCDDVIQQISAAGSALDSLGRLMLERHMRSCLVSSIRSGDDSVMEELLATIGKLMK